MCFHCYYYLSLKGLNISDTHKYNLVREYVHWLFFNTMVAGSKKTIVFVIILMVFEDFLFVAKGVVKFVLYARIVSVWEESIAA